MSTTYKNITNSEAMHPNFHPNTQDPMTIEYALGCMELDLQRLNITAKIDTHLLLEFYAPKDDEPGAVYPLTTGHHLTDCELFEERARVHEQNWKREQCRKLTPESELTGKAIHAPHIDAPTMWERNAEIVIVMQDGIEIGREVIYPNKGETVEGILAFFKHRN